MFQNLCFEKDLSGSDNDSALSSAPPSLSPQPGTQSNSPDVWQTVSQSCFLHFVEGIGWENKRECHVGRLFEENYNRNAKKRNVH